MIGGVSLSAAADEVSMLPGLQCVVSDGTNSVSRIDRRLSFDWTDSRIDSRIADVQSVTWSGNLLIRTAGPHTFHAQVSGSVKVSVDDQVVLAAEGPNVFVSGAASDSSAGDHRIQIEYQTALTHPDAKAPRDFKMQLFWSSPEFTLEPLPADALTHAAENDASDSQHGRRLVDALRCAACHSGLGELPTLKAPSLLRLRGNTSDAEIVRRLAHPESVGAWSSMPAFGFSESQAQDIAAFLVDASEAEASDNGVDTVEKSKPEDVDAGQKLLLTTGCVACHAVAQMPVGFEPAASPYHGPDLTDVKARRSGPWLMKWLKSPETLNVDHRMPVFALSDDDRRGIVARGNEADVLRGRAAEPGAAAAVAVEDRELPRVSGEGDPGARAPGALKRDGPGVVPAPDVHRIAGAGARGAHHGIR